MVVQHIIIYTDLELGSLELVGEAIAKTPTHLKSRRDTTSMENISNIDRTLQTVAVDKRIVKYQCR